MAEGTGTGRRRRDASAEGNGGSAAEEKAEREATQRVVFRREHVLVLPEGTEKVDATKLADALGIPKAAAAKLVTARAWIEVARHEGSQDQAIRAHAGEPNTPTAKPGEYRTTPARSWKGGKRYVKPPEVKVEAEELTD